MCPIQANDCTPTCHRRDSPQRTEASSHSWPADNSLVRLFNGDAEVQAGKLGQVMTTLLRFLVCIGILAQAAAAPANFFGTGSGKVAWQSDMKKAGLDAKRSGKPILLQLTASWCSYCHKMLKETYTDPAIAKKINDNFVPLLLDADENEQLVEMLEVSSFPSTIIISSEFDILGRIAGYQKPDAFSKQIATYIKPSHVQIAQTGNREAPAPVKEENRGSIPPTLSLPDPSPKSAPNLQLSTAKSSTTPASTNSKTTVTRPESATSALTQTSKLGQLEERQESFQRPRGRINVDSNTVIATTRHETTPIAFEGMCLVSMLEDREPTAGDSKFEWEYRGTHLLFRDDTQLAKFKAEPAKYWPWFDGRCPVATFNDELSVGGRPQFGGAYRGRLIFFRDADHRAIFSRDPVRYMSTTK